MLMLRVRSVNLSRGEERELPPRQFGSREGQAVPLSARDHLTVRQIPSAVDQDYVQLRGNLDSPADIALGGETLSDVIDAPGVDR